MQNDKPKSGLPRWFPGSLYKAGAGWITLIVLTPQVAVVRRPGSMMWEMTPSNWLALQEDRPDAG